MKRKLAVFGLAFALAEGFAVTVPSRALVPAAALFAMLLYLYRRYDCRVLFLGALCGTIWFAGYNTVHVAPILSLADQQGSCIVVVETDGEPSYQDGYLRGTLRVTQWQGVTTDFLVTCDAFPSAEPGERFTADFQLQSLENDSYRESYLSDGIYLQAEYQGNITFLTESCGLRFKLFRLREQLAELLQRWMPAAEGELESAMLLGRKEALRDSLEETFRAAGVSHLLAVSGLHVALLCGIFSMGRRRRFVRPLIVFRALLVLFYMFLTGLPVSVLRAGFVFLLALAGDFFWQPVDLLTSTGVVAALMGLQNAYAPCDMGFQLSFCAVLGVQGAIALSQWENRVFPVPRSQPLQFLYILFRKGMASVQTALFASAATLPVLILQGLATSGVSLLTNLLVVWMLQPALLLGVLVLGLTFVPPLAPVLRLISLILSVWLHLMVSVVQWCAALPMAYISLPARYTLFVFAVLGLLAAVFWYNRHFMWYLPAFLVCSFTAILLGGLAQQDVVRVVMAGTANNPCVICTQNGNAVVLFRGGQSNWNAVRQYLTEHAVSHIDTVVDLRQEPSELDFADAAVVEMNEIQGRDSLAILDDLTLDLYHDENGNLAILNDGIHQVATMTGNIDLTQPVSVDLFCAASTLSESVQADAVLTKMRTPGWSASDLHGRYPLFAGDQASVVIRPGRSLIFEEVELLALQ